MCILKYPHVEIPLHEEVENFPSQVVSNIPEFPTGYFNYTTHGPCIPVRYIVALGL